VVPWGEPWQVLHFWDEHGVFSGWYVNLESEKQRDLLGVTSVDWHLDLLVSPEYAVSWKDEDEAEAAVRTEYLRERDLEAARETGQAMARDPEGFIDAIGHWEDFRPAPGLDRPLALPDGWDAPASG
jgi:predicted RNA-binding protein associated with RNAse of E/G family